MRALRTRQAPVLDAIAALRAELDRHGLSAEVVEQTQGRIGVAGCVLRDSEGSVMGESSGRGGGPQAVASALFEAWENCCHKHGFEKLRRDPSRLRVVQAKEIAAQPALHDDAMVHRLAADFPDGHVACLRFDPISGGGDPIWYPAFARFPWYPQYPVEDDHPRYRPYLRYATNFGTAAGISEQEALVHALMEAVEGDAFSMALMNWYVTFDACPAAVCQEDLPEDLRRLCAEAERVIGCPPLVFDITTELGIPAFCAMPSRLSYLGAGGAGASTIPAYALERAVGELVQAYVNIVDDPEHDRRLHRRLSRLSRWPALERCVTLDPADLVARSERAPSRPPQWWDPPDAAPRIDTLTAALADAGLTGYFLRWNDGAVPVVTVLVPGLETFFLSRAGVPVLPTGRGARRWHSATTARNGRER
ncbi:YcaO-like family protein [Thermoactinospora rubra]|uniref:YcaO-like family protein n=1 Tax=Thermoactinospora rubra TaxID=1088767 RepID=UPI001180367E|nr:YcaO-like family protein [Thermoactinospora rubra]